MSSRSMGVMKLEFRYSMISWVIESPFYSMSFTRFAFSSTDV
jgi:hypothetical protein